jgi:hypothetical protein
MQRWFLGLQLVFAKVVELDVSSRTGFAFVGKFVFTNDHTSWNTIGTIMVNLTMDETFPHGFPPMNVLLYDDEDGGWPMIYDRGYKDIPCPDMLVRAVTWQKELGHAEWTIDWSDKKEVSLFTGISEKMRTRTWYVALANCEPFEGVHARIEFKNTRYSPGNQQFGADEVGLDTLFILASVAFWILLGLNLFSLVKVWQREHYIHHVLKIFTFSLVLQLAALQIHVIHWSTYAVDGQGHPDWDDIADVFHVCAQVSLMFLLLLMAQGWTITSNRLTGRNFIFTCCSIFFALKLLLELWTAVLEDPAATEQPFVFDAFSLCLTIMWLIFAFYFGYLLIHSFTEESNPVKRSLFKGLGIVYGPWMVGHPGVILLSMAIAPWLRDVVVRTTSVSISTIGYAVMVFLMWHSRVSGYFETSVPIINYDRVLASSLADEGDNDGL